MTRTEPGTSIKIKALATALQNHSDGKFVDFLINGFTHGFHSGIDILPNTSHFCSNLQSALAEPHTADILLAKELKEGFMKGHFDKAIFCVFVLAQLV